MPRVSRSEFADLEGVHRSMVTRWIAAGRISPPGPDGLLDLDQARRELRATEDPSPQAMQRREQVAAQKAAKRAAARAARTDPGQDPTAPPAAARAGRQAHARGDAAAELAPRPAPSAVDPDPGQLERVGLGLKLETYKLQKAKAELANLELDQRAGLLVERAEVDFILADFASTVRGYVEGLGKRLAPQVFGHRGDQASLEKLFDDFAREMLEQIAAHLARCAHNLDDPKT